MKEIFQDLLDLFPCCLIFILPVFLCLAAPINMAEASQEFTVHRMSHFDYGSHSYGSKVATVAMEARALSAKHLLRKMVVAKLNEVSLNVFQTLTDSGAGGLLLLIPPPILNPNNESSKKKKEKDLKETILNLEDQFWAQDFQYPVFLAEETEDLLELHDALSQSTIAGEQSASATQTLMDAILSNGYQLVTTASAPKALKDQTVFTLQSSLSGGEEALPTIILLAHYDTHGLAPSLSFGADSNGSGVTILLELARLFNNLFKSHKSNPNYNLVFLLTGGGELNYFGTKKWIEEQKDDQNSEILSSAKFVLCLDTLGQGSNINLHVSKPPKEDSPAHKFVQDLNFLTQKLYPATKVNLVHKKINLAEEELSWEHEVFSINKLSGAMTLSHLESPVERSSILDTKVDENSLTRNLHLIAETLTCSIFELDRELCQGNSFALKGNNGITNNSIKAWTSELASRPRSGPYVVGSQSKASSDINPTIDVLRDALNTFTHDVKVISGKRDKKEQEFNFYSVQEVQMNAYLVKPAVFDLVLSICIASYLGLIHLFLNRSDLIISCLGSISSSISLSSKIIKTQTNGHSLNHKLKSQ